MKLGVLFSGGKDSVFALYKAMQKEEVVCLISIISKNPSSYMFHTPNITLSKLQSEAIGIPIIQKETLGQKEKELCDLKEALILAKKEFGIEGVVTGAVESIYQSARIQALCFELGLWCFNPLWQINQIKLLESTLKLGLKTMITGVFAYPITSDWLGIIIDEKTIAKLKELNKKYQINPAGEGGEIETTVLNAPFFRKQIEIISFQKEFKEGSGILKITEAKLK